MNKLIDTDLCAKEFAVLHFPPTAEELNKLYQEGLPLFKDMTQFQTYYRKGTLDQFSRTYLFPLIIKRFREGYKYEPV